MPFNIALTGLRASQDDLRITGNNIANASTVGFKRSRAEFADIFASSFSGINANIIGSGVRLADVAQQFTQGTINFTGNALDLALNGGGFFVVNDPSSNTDVYTRAGNLQVDRNGFVVTPNGQRLQSFPVVDPALLTFNTATLQDVQLPTAQGNPSATTAATLSMNLQADTTNLGAGAIDPTMPNTFNFSTSLSVFDSLGVAHTATMYFRKTAPLTFDTQMVIDGDVTQTTTPVTMTFNPDGTIATPSPLQLSVDFGGAFNPGNGANNLDFTVDITQITAFGSPFVTNAITQDGFTTGRLASVEIDDSGVLFARFTNGQSQPVGQIALADFANPQGLNPLGNNVWAQTFDAGDRVLGEAGTGDLGSIQAAALEQSNVQLEDQLVNLILAQRNFQANAQVISTADNVTQTIINI